MQGKWSPPHNPKIVHDVWETTVGGVNLTVGVLETNPDIPAYFAQTHDSSHAEIHFERFHPNQHFDPSIFDVPSICNQ